MIATDVKYVVTIVRTADGVSREFLETHTPWESPDDNGSGSIGWWTDGNGGCDCNRALYFKRAAGESDLDDETRCGETQYRVPYVTLPDGTRITVDK